MADINYSSSRGNRVQEVSRQFTDAERSVDERVTSHLQAPMREAYGDAASGYAWYAQDMKLRSAITAQLSQEQALAGAQSVRQELDRKFVQDAEDDLVAMSAIKQARGLVDSGEASSIQHANEMIASQYPEINVNKKWGQYYDQASKIQDPSARQEAEARLAFNTLKLEDDFSTVERFKRAKSEVGEAALLQREVDALNGTGLAARNNVEGEKLRAKNYQLADMKHEEDLRNFKMLGSDPNSAQARVSVRGSLKNSGVTGISNFSSIGSYAVANPNAVRALHDKAWRSNAFETPEEEDSFLGAWKTMGNTEPGTPEFNAAMEVLDDASYRYSEDTRQAGEHTSRMKSLLEVDEMLDGKFTQFRKEIDAGLKTAATDRRTPQQKIDFISSKLPALMSSFEGMVSEERLAPYKEAASMLMAGQDPDVETPEQAYQKFELLAANMAQQFKGDIAAGKTTTAANVAAAKKLATPSNESPDPLSDAAPDSERQAAIKWLEENPNHPQAPAIKAKLGIQ